jgi:hypothetical protein
MLPPGGINHTKQEWRQTPPKPIFPKFPYYEKVNKQYIYHDGGGVVMRLTVSCAPSWE